MIEFFVEGIPKSTQTGSVIRAGNRAFPVYRNTSWAAVFGEIARQHKPSVLLDGPIQAKSWFFFMPPKSMKHGSKGWRQYPTVRPDIDGLVKKLYDSLNGVLWTDDARIVNAFLYKRYVGDPAFPDVLFPGARFQVVEPHEIGWVSDVIKCQNGMHVFTGVTEGLRCECRASVISAEEYQEIARTVLETKEKGS